MTIRRFEGKPYTLKGRQHSKRDAETFATKQRQQGKSARITSDKSGGHANYNVWVR